MTLARIAALLGLSLAAPHGVQLSNVNPAVCATYAQIEVPAADLPTDADRQRLMDCDSVRLYFGFDKPARVVDARKCAYLQWQGVTAEKALFASAEVLTMIYANGRGATRNYDLALKFACEIGGAPAENSGRVEHLERLKTQGRTRKDFHICDDSTSGLSEGICGAVQEEFDSVARQRRRDALMANWRPAEKDAWRDLQKTADEFFAASAANETDRSGSNRTFLAIFTRAALADGLVKAVEEFEHGRLPRATPAEYTRADARLNARYRQLQAHEFPAMVGVEASTIKTAQRVWLRYREAWVEFGKIKYPSVTADSWRTWLTRQRIAMWNGIDIM
jgi:uncharacterized protein YecT (DUF1311 family)